MRVSSLRRQRVTGLPVDRTGLPADGTEFWQENRQLLDQYELTFSCKHAPPVRLTKGIQHHSKANCRSGWWLLPSPSLEDCRVESCRIQKNPVEAIPRNISASSAEQKAMNQEDLQRFRYPLLILVAIKVAASRCYWSVPDCWDNILDTFESILVRWHLDIWCPRRLHTKPFGTGHRFHMMRSTVGQ